MSGNSLPPHTHIAYQSDTQTHLTLRSTHTHDDVELDSLVSLCFFVLWQGNQAPHHVLLPMMYKGPSKHECIRDPPNTNV